MALLHCPTKLGYPTGRAMPGGSRRRTLPSGRWVLHSVRSCPTTFPFSMDPGVKSGKPRSTLSPGVREQIVHSLCTRRNSLSSGRDPAPSFLGLRRPLAPAVQEVKQGNDGMSPEHSGTRMAHHQPDLLAHGRLEAVDGAVDAGGLVGAKRAASDPLLRVLPQGEAVGARAPPIAVIATAIDRDHHTDCLQLAIDPPLPGGRDLGVFWATSRQRATSRIMTIPAKTPPGGPLPTAAIAWYRSRMCAISADSDASAQDGESFPQRGTSGHRNAMTTVIPAASGKRLRRSPAASRSEVFPAVAGCTP